ncbi:hypothetical protein J19TS2_28370 [Cohnella xylanilytica]|uniref:hypothetical protein n=1 Tax=Cohnella xylanilytica TaxID=557555 RepID=UPI001B1658E2|nr:hypothetical protein [Cohnella xylanilytica]GIO13282.1 hypothetical protein J19TS2_28370 [Cohnella xylanilytica]
MNRAVGVIRMQLRDKWLWIYMPWLILALSFAINFAIRFFARGEVESYTGALSSLYGFIFVNGIMTITQWFPFSIGLSVRRIDFFKGTSSLAVFLCALYSVILYVLALAEESTSGWGVQMHFFSIPWFSDGTEIERIWVLFSLMLHLYFLGLTFSSWYRRFGRNALFFLLVFLALALSIIAYLFTYYEFWDEAWNRIRSISAAELLGWLTIPTFLYAFFSYLLIRRATV